MFKCFIHEDGDEKPFQTEVMDRKRGPTEGEFCHK